MNDALKVNDNTKKKFAVAVDDIFDDLFNEMLIVADQGNNHRALFEADTPHEAARMMTSRLNEFFKKHFYECDSDGYPLKEANS